MSKRKAPAKPKPVLPAQGGSYVREKDGTLAPEPVSGNDHGAAAPDALRPDPRREHRHQPDQLAKE